MIRILSWLQRLSLFRGRTPKRVPLLLFGTPLVLVVSSFCIFHFSKPRATSFYKPRTTPEDLSLPEDYLSPFHTKVPSLDYCTRRIEEAVHFGRTTPAPSTHHVTDYHLYKTFSRLSCRQISALFLHSQPTDAEKNFPLAYVLLLYKGAGLFVKQLQFIYMPHNVYCIHIDASSSSAFVNAVEQVVRCLPNVFITKKRIKVMYMHVSTVQAQLNCVEELLESSVPWRYLFNLCGQDFTLYANQGMVQALQALNGTTNSESLELTDNTRIRTSYVYEVKQVSTISENHGFQWSNTGKRKTQSPYGIKIYKGSSYIAGTREFCEYAVNDETAKAFLNWLNDTYCVDESFFSSLYRHPGVPGGITGEQPEFITRVVKWAKSGEENLCYGYWLRGLCVLSLADLSWALGPKFQNGLFIQKIDFDYDAELVDCLFVKVQNRTRHPYSNNEIS
ncbi:hypothetical protein ACROYT_G034795 [Oculina patagonica]